MYHEIKDNIYYLYNDKKELVMTVQLEENNQVIISTDKEVFSGPIDFLTLTSDV